MSERPATANYVEKPDDDDDVMTVEDYLNAVQVGAYIDYDGWGLPMKDGLNAKMDFWEEDGKDASNLIRPSDKDLNIPLDATHVVWYNR